MTLASLIPKLVVVELAAIGVACVLLVGHERLAGTRSDVRRRVRSALPYFAGLGFILLLNRVARTTGPELSWMIGLNITANIHALEGSTITVLQAFATPSVTSYFSFMYVYGYVFLLVFPLVAYLCDVDDMWLRRLVVAYSVNYAVGLCCYVLFVAYGPRNLVPDQVESLFYMTEPSLQLLTTEINTNTNVFPSLHTSLSATVALVAFHTRRRFPRWYYVATVIAISIILSTMYLGIHWGTDVVAGIGLAFLSVYIAQRVVRSVDGKRAGLRDISSLRQVRSGR